MSKVTKEFIALINEEYKRYKGEKETLNTRVRENDYWYKARYGRIINPKSNETEPVTAFMFSSIENKYADAVDNFPVPNILEREPKYEEISKLLSKVVPAQLDMSEFKKAYKINWRRKLKHGTGIYGVFYDGENIIIKALSILNVYCDMHVNDVQESQFLYIVNAIDNEELKTRYPEFESRFNGNATLETFEGVHEMKNKTEIIDCYYRKGGKLHCIKLCGGEMIDSTEESGKELYAHGMFPVVFDCLYPEEDCPFGFGIIDIAKNPQIYIDRLDSAIIKNSILSSKIRLMIKDNGSVNEDEVADFENDIIHVAGGIDNESIRELQVGGLPSYVLEHRTRKIDELKEIVGNRDFQQGGTSGGVTAASAISALQEAGNKTARSMIDDAYDAYKKVVQIVIELMREFYSDKHIYRFDTGSADREFLEFSADMLYDSEDGRPIIFDVSIVPEKQNPFQREANNTMIKELWSSGVINSENIELSIITLQAMTFDGKEKLIQLLRDYQKKNNANGGVKVEDGVLQAINEIKGGAKK